MRGKKITQEEVKQTYAEKGYELISEYKKAKGVLFLKDNNGYICRSTYDSFKRGCIPSVFHVSNPYTIQNIYHFIDLNMKGYKLLSKEYKNSGEHLLFQCPEGHEFEMSWDNFKQGYKCPYCSKQKVLKGYNDIATTDPWMIEFFKNKEDSYVYACNSNKNIQVVCPYCGKEKEILISNLYKRKSIQCSCGDGTSYPEKFIIYLLDQLGIAYQHDSYWIENKRYDFYLSDYNIIIECHGIQHYTDSFKGIGGRSLQEEQKNDKYKKELALKNGFTYIELDCRESTLEQIKNSVLNSKLSYLFDLSKIDWLMCESKALSNRVKEVCNYWHLHNEINNEGLTINNISKIFNLGQNTIYNYLQRGAKLGWCNYQKRKSNQVEIFKDEKSLGVFESCKYLEQQSEELFGVKLLKNNISAVCSGRIKQYKGFTFKYIEG